MKPDDRLALIIVFSGVAILMLVLTGLSALSCKCPYTADPEMMFACCDMFISPWFPFVGMFCCAVVFYLASGIEDDDRYESWERWDGQNDR